jgi:hypothetical protein
MRVLLLYLPLPPAIVLLDVFPELTMLDQLRLILTDWAIIIAAWLCLSVH